MIFLINDPNPNIPPGNTVTYLDERSRHADARQGDRLQTLLVNDEVAHWKGREKRG